MKQSQDIKTIAKKEIRKLQGVIATYYLSNKLFRFSKQEMHIDSIVGDSFEQLHLPKLSIIGDLHRHIQQIGDKELEIEMVVSQQQHIYLFMVIEQLYYLASINTQQVVIDIPTVFTSVIPIVTAPILQILIKSKVITCKFFEKKQSLSAYLFVANSEGGRLLIQGRQEQKRLFFREMAMSRGQSLNNKHIKSILFLQRQLVYVYNNAEMRIYKLNTSNYQQYLHPKKAIQNQIRKHQNKYELISVIQSHPHFYFLFSAPQSKNRHVLIKQTHLAEFGKGTQQKYYIPSPLQSQGQAKIHILSQTQHVDCILSQGKKHFLVQINDSGQIKALPICTHQQKIQFGMNKSRLVWFTNTHYHVTNAFIAQNKVLKLDSKSPLNQIASTQSPAKKVVNIKEDQNIRRQNNRLNNLISVTSCNSDQEGDQKPSSPLPAPPLNVNQPQSFLSFGVKPLPSNPQANFISFGMHNKFDQTNAQFELPSLNRNITFGNSSKQTAVRTKMGAVGRAKLLEISRNVNKFNLLMVSVLSNCSRIEKEGMKIMRVKKELSDYGKGGQMGEMLRTLIKQSKQLSKEERIQKNQKYLNSKQHQMSIDKKASQFQRQYNNFEAVTNYYLQIVLNKKSIKSKQLCPTKIELKIEKEIIILKSKVYQQKQLWFLLQSSFNSVKMNMAKTKDKQMRMNKELKEEEAKGIRQRLKTFLCW